MAVLIDVAVGQLALPLAGLLMLGFCAFRHGDALAPANTLRPLPAAKRLPD